MFALRLPQCHALSQTCTLSILWSRQGIKLEQNDHEERLFTEKLVYLPTLLGDAAFCAGTDAFLCIPDFLDGSCSNLQLDSIHCTYWAVIFIASKTCQLLTPNTSSFGVWLFFNSIQFLKTHRAIANLNETESKPITFQNNLLLLNPVVFNVFRE